MKFLPQDFEITKYGVTTRLVNEGDAEFITQLRSDNKLGRYIHASNGDVEAQRKWIFEYKRRESEGLDFYLIFYKEGKPYGLCRIYNIDWLHLSYTAGSWMCSHGTSVEDMLLTSHITSEVALEILGLKVNIYEVLKENKHVVKFHRNILKAYEYAETDDFYLFMSTPETRKNSKLKKYLGIE